GFRTPASMFSAGLRWQASIGDQLGPLCLRNEAVFRAICGVGVVLREVRFNGRCSTNTAAILLVRVIQGIFGSQGASSSEKTNRPASALPPDSPKRTRKTPCLARTIENTLS